MKTYAIVDNLRTPGIVMTAHIDVTLVSNRVFKAAHRMVDSLIFKGGYRSQSRKLAGVLAYRYGLPMATPGYNSVRIQRSSDLPPDVIAEIEELLDADLMIAIGLRPPGGHEEYLTRNCANSKGRLRALSGVNYSYLTVHNEDMQMEICKVLAKHWLSYPHIADKRDTAVRELVCGAPIPFNPFTDYNN